MNKLTVREAAEEIISIGTGLSSAHPIGNKLSDIGKFLIHVLDEANVTWVVDSEYGDYCCDCGTPIRMGDDPYTSTAELRGRWIYDPQLD